MMMLQRTLLFRCRVKGCACVDSIVPMASQNLCINVLLFGRVLDVLRSPHAVCLSATSEEKKLQKWTVEITFRASEKDNSQTLHLLPI
jgi:hypothetical protein